MDPADDPLTDDGLPDDARVPIRVRVSAFSDPTVLRSLVGLLVALAVLLWPGRSGAVLAWLVGLGLVGTGFSGLWSLVRSRSRRAVRWLSTLAGLGLGPVLVLSPVRSTVFVVRVLAVWLAVSAVGSLIERWRAGEGNDPGPRDWEIVRTVSLLLGAALLAAYPAELLAVATAIAAATFALLAVVAITHSVSADDERVYDVGDSIRMVNDWLAERPKSLEDREALYSRLLYEGPRARAKIGRFLTLMVLASVISATGVLADSTAVVIGPGTEAPSATELAAGLSDALGREMTAEVRLLVQKTETATGRSG